MLIGKDTRISGYMLEAALEAGFSSAGVDVVLCGPLPTPAVAYLTRALRLDAGIVISASHNPYPDNGIKFFSERGTKLPDAVEERIEQELDQPWHCVDARRLGKVRRLDDAAGRYIEFCKRTFPNDFDLKGLKLVVDSANGAAYHVAPHVFHELGADVVSHGASPNGLNINDGVGALHAEQLAHAVQAAEADLGIALDGDADRVLICDADGRLYNGDELLYVIVRDRMRLGKVAGAVGTLMTNYALERRFGELGVGFARAKVGDRYVLEMLEEKGWQFGGEGSGHLLCLDCHSTGDGIVSALQVLAAMKRSGQTLAAADGRSRAAAAGAGQRTHRARLRLEVTRAAGGRDVDCRARTAGRRARADPSVRDRAGAARDGRGRRTRDRRSDGAAAGPPRRNRSAPLASRINRFGLGRAFARRLTRSSRVSARRVAPVPPRPARVALAAAAR